MRQEVTQVPMRTGDNARSVAIGPETESGVSTASEESAQGAACFANFRGLIDIGGDMYYVPTDRGLEHWNADPNRAACLPSCAACWWQEAS